MAGIGLGVVHVRLVLESSDLRQAIGADADHAAPLVIDLHCAQLREDLAQPAPRGPGLQGAQLEQAFNEQSKLVLRLLIDESLILQQARDMGLSADTEVIKAMDRLRQERKLDSLEALEKEIGPRPGRTRFGIVLLTPDDMGYAKADGEGKVEPRARQNVVLEMGMLISALGRPNVAILKKGHIEIPSDAHGIIYISFNDHIREAVPRLVDRLRAAGFEFNAECITRASS